MPIIKKNREQNTNFVSKNYDIGKTDTSNILTPKKSALRKIGSLTEEKKPKQVISGIFDRSFTEETQGLSKLSKLDKSIIPPVEKDTLFKKAVRALLPKSVETYFGLSEIEPKTIAEKMEKTEGEVQSYYREKRKEESLKELAGLPKEEYTPPETLMEKMGESVKQLGYFNSDFLIKGYLLPTVGTLAEQYGIGAEAPRIREWGERFADQSLYKSTLTKTMQSAQDVPSLLEGGLKDPRYYGKTISSALGFFGAILGSSIAVTALTRNPVAGAATGFAVGGSLESANAYQNMIDKGIDPESANLGATVYGAVSSIIENSTGLKPALGVKKIATDFAEEVAKSGAVKTFMKKWLEEGLVEEGSQQLVQNLITRVFKKDQKVTEDMAESIVGGMVGSLPMVGGAYLYNKTSEKEPKVEPATTTQEVKAEPTEKPSSDVLDKVEKNVTFYQQMGTSIKGDKQPENAALRDLKVLAEDEEVIKHTQEQVKNITNENGKVTLYRVGEPTDVDRLVSATYDKNFANDFAEAVKATRDVKPKITEFEVNTEDIKIFIGEAEKEVLVHSSMQKPTELLAEEQISDKEVKTEPLIEEAKKYKSADEFIEAQPKLFHGTKKDFDTPKLSDIVVFNNKKLPIKGFFGTTARGEAEKFGNITKEFIISPNAKIKKEFGSVEIPSESAKKEVLEAIQKAKDEGFDVLQFKRKIPSGGTFDDVLKNRKTLRELKNKDDYKKAVIKQDGDVDKGIFKNIDEYLTESTRKELRLLKEEVSPTHFIILNENAIKTKSQLKDIYNKAQGTKTTSLLAEKAKKFDTVEEFVEAQQKVYHGTNQKELKFVDAIKSEYADKRMATFASSDKQVGEMFGKNIHELTPNFRNPLIIDAKKNNYYEIPIPKELRKDIHPSLKTIDTDSIVEIAQARGNDSIIIKRVIEGSGEYDTADARDLFIGLKKDSFLTKQQLTDIYNQEKGEVAPKDNQPLAEKAKKFDTVEEFVKSQINAFHGSPNQFDKFSYENMGTQGTSEGYGFYFTDKKSIAEGYSREGGSLKEAFVKIDKPLPTDKLTITPKQLETFLRKLDPDGQGYLSNWGDVDYDGYDKTLKAAVKGEMDGPSNDVDLITGIINADGKNVEAAYKILKDTLGYDGIIEKNPTWGNNATIGTPQTIRIAFNNDQIISKQQLTEEWNKANETKKTSVASDTTGKVAKEEKNDVSLPNKKTEETITEFGDKEVKEVLDELKEMTKSESGIISIEPILSIKDALKTTKKGVSEYETLKDLWIGEKDVLQLKTDVEKRKLQSAIKNILGKSKYDDTVQNYDKAIQIYIDAKRNPGDLSKYYSKLSPEQKEIVDLAKKLPSEIKQVAMYISNSYRILGNKALDAGVIKNVLDNYAGRIWDLDNKSSMETFRKFGTTSKHAKQRKLTTIVEGWASGLELKVSGATNNLNVLKQEINKTASDKQFIKSLSELKDIDGNRILTTTKLDGYAEVKHPNFKLWRPAGVGAVDVETFRSARNFFKTEDGIIMEKKSLYAPIEVAKNINNMLGESSLKDIPVVKTITKYNAILKAWILQSSFFHHMAFSRSYLLGTHGKSLKETNIKIAYKDGIKMMEEMSPIVELGVKNGLTLGIKQDWNEELVRQKTFIGNVLDRSKATKVIKDKIIGLRQKQADFLFGELGAGLKAKAFAIEFRNLVKKYPNEDVNELAKISANLINDDFGGLHLQRMGRNPTVQHMFRIFALAPDWTESNIRSMAKSIKAGGTIEKKVYRRFWASILTKGLTITLLSNMFMAGLDKDDEKTKGMWERFVRNYKTSWEQGRLMWTGVDITPLYKMFGGETKERKYFSIFGHFIDPLKFILQPIRSAQYKGSVVSKLFYDALKGSDYAQRPFTTFKELMGVDKEKGVYKTTRKGYYKKGDPKWGKLKGKTVAYKFGGGGTLEYEQIPSYLLNELKGVQPVQVQNLISWWAGELAGFDAVLNSLGLGIKSTYGLTEKSKQE